MGLLDRVKTLFGGAEPATPNTSPTPDPAEAAEQARQAGNAALHDGQFELALQHYNRFATLEPARAAAHANRGFALLNLGRAADAEDAFRRALELAPTDHEAAYFLARALQAQDRHGDAEALYRQSVLLQRDFGHGWLALAALQEQRAAFDEARQSIRQAVRASPDLADGWQALARLALRAADPAEALTAAQRWARLDPQQPHALGMQADALRCLGRADEALAAANAALSRAPADPRLTMVRGQVLFALQRFDASAEAMQPVVGVLDDADAWAAYGAALLGCERNDEAAAALDEVLVRSPDHPDGLHNRALADMNRQRYAQAAERLEGAVQRHPDDARLQFDLAVAWLTLGRWRDGWRQYEWRLPRRSESSWPRWRPGESVAGRRLLVRAEQGLGDSIQFARYLPRLRELTAELIVQMPPRLHQLLEPVTTGCRVVSEAPAPDQVDLQAPLLSVPHLLDLAEPEGMTSAYVRADETRLDHWRGRLVSAERRLRVGLVWAGNPDHPDDRRRSLPLETLRLALQDLADIQFVSLQMALRDADRPAAQAWPDLVQVGAEQRDMADTAALVEALDVTVCVDTSVAHLVGALDRPLLLLLPHNADWRWNVGRDDTPWYPQARLLRQPRPGDWASVVAVLRERLQAWPR